MTDHYKGFIVGLARDMRDDDAEAIVTALRMVKGVASVEPLVADMTDHLARIRVAAEVRDNLYAAIDSALHYGVR